MTISFHNVAWNETHKVNKSDRQIECGVQYGAVFGSIVFTIYINIIHTQ